MRAGLPSDAVKSVACDQYGRIWVGTAEGLARLEGTNLTVFDRRNTPALISDDCLSLAVDVDGSL